MKADGRKKKLSVKQYLNKITQHLYDLINEVLHSIARRVWKIQISMRVNFISSKDTGETCTILYAVIMQTLCGVVTQIILLENFLSLFKINIKRS